MTKLSLELIQEAQAFLRGKIRQTPIEYSKILSESLGGDVYLKLENLQVTGSFKARGAFFRLSKLSEQEKKCGVITCSAGNHGKAVAYVSHQMNIPATIYVPKNVDESKYEGMKALGAEVIKSPSVGFDDTEILAREAAEKSGRPFISAFEDTYIMAGNGGTLGAEIMEQLPSTKTVALPVGGGGLCGGLSFYIKGKFPEVAIFGSQLKQSPSLKMSLEQGTAVTKLPSIDTIAGGIEGGIGKECFEIIKSRIEDCLLVTEEEIHKGFRWCLENHQYLVEPTGVAALSAVLGDKISISLFPLVVVLTGRNVSMKTLKNVLNERGSPTIAATSN